LQAPTLFLIADDLRHMEIAANIDETDVGRVRPGQKVSFTVNAYPGRNFEGSVKQVRLGSQTVANVVIYTTIISVENPRKELMPGMTANLRVETDVRENVLRVANAALRWRPPGAEPVTAQAAAGAREENGAGERPGGGGGERRAGGGGGRVMAEFAAALKAELALSGDQQKEVDAMLAQARKELGVTFRSEQDPNARRERVRQQWSEISARIAASLTPEQKAKFDELRQRFAQSRGEAGATQRGRVYVLGAEGKPEPIDVRTGVSDSGVTEILTNRLDAGREIITGGGPRTVEAAAAPRRGPRFGF
jgi:HlyD family secretion protein